MNQNRIEQIEILSDKVNNLPAAERAEFLSAACANDAELRHKVEELLTDVDQTDNFLVQNVWQELAQDLGALPSAFEPGQVVVHYRILQPLGAGGMGKIYLAEDEKLMRQVAIKFLTGEFVSYPDLVRRFEQEAHAASALNHPNIITIHEIGQHQDAPYITYELVEGETLRQRINRGALDWQEAVAISAQIASALKAAHSAGIIHRDIKPENVMLRADGLVKVLDFGIAKRFDLPALEAKADVPTAAVASATLAGQVLGTAGYLSPEQGRGEEIDAGTDIFSLGLVIYEMLGGHPYADLRPQGKLEAVIIPEELPHIGARCKELPAALDAIVTKATRKARAERYASAGEMLDALSELRLPAQTKLYERERVLAQARANQLLNQSVALYASDKSVRLSPTALWAIWRWSNIKRGKLEREMVRKSLLGALGKAGAIALTAGLVALALAAWISVDERWDEQVMHDGHTHRVKQLALSPDGQTLVSVGYNKEVIVWDLARRERRATLNGHTHDVTAVTFSHDGKWFATAGNDNQVIIWDTERLTSVKVLPGIRDLVSTIAFTPDGRFLVGAGKIWEVGSWRKIADVAGKGSFLLSPNGRLLTSSDWRTFDLASGREITKSTHSNIETGGEQDWGDGALSPDGTRLAAVDNGGSVNFWDMSRFWSTGEHRLINRYPAHRDHGHAMAYSPDGRLVASGSENIILWNAQTHEKLARFTAKDTVNGLIFSRDSRQIISAHGDGAVMIWDIAEKEMLANLAEHCGPVLAASFSPDGQSIVSASEDHSVIIWDAGSRLKRRVLIGHRAPVRDAVFSADGQCVLSADLYGNAILWDAATGAQLRAFASARRKDTDFSYRAALSPNKQWVATSFGVYSTADGRLVVGIIPPPNPYTPDIHGVAFSRDGRWLACVATGGYIALWDVAQWRLHQTLQIKGNNFNAVTFSPDGRQLAIGNNDGEIQLWQVEPLKQVGTMKRHTSGIESLAFTPDGSVLASAGDDESVALWNVARQRFICNIGRHTLPVLAVSFAPDGHLTTGEHDQSVRVYTRHRSLWGLPLD